MKIVVLAGGTSTERDVSLITGSEVYKALKSKGHKTVLLDVFLGYEGDADSVFSTEKDWLAGIEAVKEINPDISAIKAKRAGEKCFFGPNVLEICSQADVVFMALHGANGEDGKIQATFELFGIPFTGTDYLSSGIAMDKALTKQLFLEGGVQTPKGMDCLIKDATDTLGYPEVVKVNTGGSSVGVYIVNNKEEFDAALADAEKYDTRVVLEQFIKGREFTCGVIEGKALPIVEIAPKAGFYDYKNKYQAGSTEEICPAPLTEEETKKMQAMAEKAFQVLRLQAYARFDFIMSEDGEMYCLEGNTLPGMTGTSLLPQEAKAVGIEFPELCEKIIEVSLKCRA